MPEPPPNPELLRALGRLARGLTALFWGLPAALVICVHIGLKNRLELRLFDFILPVVANGLLLYGITLMTEFHPQERIWIRAVDRARAVGMALVGLAPFLYWRVKLPEEPAYAASVLLLAVFGIYFLFHLNHLLQRLVAMLPDTALRQETMTFTTLNQYLLAAIPLGMALMLGLVAFLRSGGITPAVAGWLQRAESTNEWLFLLLTLLPVATTMALVWKIKEAVFSSVFGAEK
jgi:hypothetical protein